MRYLTLSNSFLSNLRFLSFLFLSTLALPVYAIPLSPIDKAVEKECSAPIEDVKETSLKYQRCIQLSGGKESIKAAQCKKENEAQQFSENRLEKCKMVASHKMLDVLSDKEKKQDDLVG
jgi:hypothetical protein